MILGKDKYKILHEKVKQNPIENIRMNYYFAFAPERIERIYCDNDADPKVCVIEFKGADFADHNSATFWVEDATGLEWLKNWSVDYPLLFVAVKEKIYSAVKEEWNLEDSPAELWYLPEEVEVEEPKHVVEPLRKREEDIEEVNENWTYSTGHIQDYIREKIEKGETFAVYLGEKLASYAIYRENGAMGMLRTLPEFRGKGIAKSITWAMIKDIRSKGRIPHCFILPDNIASQGVVKNCGFQKDGTFYWFFIDPQDSENNW